MATKMKYAPDELVIALNALGQEIARQPWGRVSPSACEAANNFMAYWSNLRNGTAIPSRAALDPMDITQLLPNVFLCKIHIDGERVGVRFGVHGTRVAEIVGKDLTGKWLADVLPSDRAQAVGRAIVLSTQEGLPVRQRFFNRFPNREFMLVDRTILPLADANGAVTEALGLLSPCQIGAPQELDTQA